MIFNEIYGCYYNTVAKIIASAVAGELDDHKLHELIRSDAFPESELTIYPAIKEQQWLLIESDFHTPIQNRPQMPLTDLQKRWLKTISLDPRIRLFEFPMQEMEAVEPLFLPEDIVYFDRYQDGDPYGEDWYIAHFHKLRQALLTRKKVNIQYRNRHDQERQLICAPLSIEYSDQDDKFRLQAVSEHERFTINLARIRACEVLDECYTEEDCTTEQGESRSAKAVIRLRDERNALERAMMQFAQYRKEVDRLSETEYDMILWYDRADETDLLIQLLRFGPMVKVLEPERLRENIMERIQKQREMFAPFFP